MSRFQGALQVLALAEPERDVGGQHRGLVQVLVQVFGPEDRERPVGLVGVDEDPGGVHGRHVAPRARGGIGRGDLQDLLGRLGGLGLVALQEIHLGQRLEHRALGPALGEVDGFQRELEALVEVVLVLEDAPHVGAEDQGILRVAGGVIFEELDGLVLGRRPAVEALGQAAVGVLDDLAVLVLLEEGLERGGIRRPAANRVLAEIELRELGVGDLLFLVVGPAHLPLGVEGHDLLEFLRGLHVVIAVGPFLGELEERRNVLGALGVSRGEALVRVGAAGLHLLQELLEFLGRGIVAHGPVDFGPVAVQEENGRRGVDGELLEDDLALRLLGVDPVEHEVLGQEVLELGVVVELLTQQFTARSGVGRKIEEDQLVIDFGLGVRLV